MNSQPNKRLLLIIVSAVDVLISGVVLLIYFGFLPVDLSGLGVSRGVIGLVGGLWFLSALIVLVYQLTKTESIE
jgi:hypothetical protein